MDSLKFPSRPPCPTLLCHAGHMAISDVAGPQGGQLVAIFYSLDTPRCMPMDAFETLRWLCRRTLANQNDETSRNDKKDTIYLYGHEDKYRFHSNNF
jgi:hypothetical protein